MIDAKTKVDETPNVENCLVSRRRSSEDIRGFENCIRKSLRRREVKYSKILLVFSPEQGLEYPSQKSSERRRSWLLHGQHVEGKEMHFRRRSDRRDKMTGARGWDAQQKPAPGKSTFFHIKPRYLVVQ